MILYDNQLKSYDYEIIERRSKGKRKGEKTNVKKLCNDICCFDTETTSAWLKDGKVIGYEKGHTNDYWNDLQSLALVYIWQFSMNDTVYYGRKIEDFLQVLSDLPSDTKFIIYVHNLPFDFVFLENILSFDDVFARAPHKPMKAISKEYPHIEFRCSYALTRLSLDAWGKQVNFHKKTGQLDYEKLRTPMTPLYDDELEYCEYDLLVMYHGLKVYRKRYGTVENIPLTQTGTVRRDIKDLLMSDINYNKFVKTLIPVDYEQYKILQQYVFAGGYTHANYINSGYVITGHIEHGDFASSYPYTMISEKYPCTPWYYTGEKVIPDDFDTHAYIMKLKFSQLKSISFNTYIQASKCINLVKGRKDNGRVISADELVIYVTEIDYITIRNNYEWKDLQVLELYKSTKKYLPKRFIEYILDLYEKKTKLKGVKGKEEEYIQSKQYINSLFGMCVTAILQADVYFNMNDGSWEIDKISKSKFESHIKKLHNFSMYEKRYFLSYSWGVYITSYARRNLWKIIEKYDSDIIYCDTDSAFIIGQHDYTWYNDEVISKLKSACKHHDIDFERTRPCTSSGKHKQLGIFEKEPDCSAFITLGSKRYLERRVDGELYLTVSGINKQAVKLLKNDMSNFKDGFSFDKDSEHVTKKLATYLNDMPTIKYPDGFISSYKYGVNLRRTGYKISITDDYKKLINYEKPIDIGDISDSFINKLRGYVDEKKEIL